MRHIPPAASPPAPFELLEIGTFFFLKYPLDKKPIPKTYQELPDTGRIQEDPSPDDDDVADTSGDEDPPDDAEVLLRYANWGPVDGLPTCRAWFHCVDPVPPESDFCVIHSEIMNEIRADGSYELMWPTIKNG